MSEPQRFHKLRSVQVTKGFLAGAKVEFSDHLSCVIGTRGAGKTTLLEFVRYALALDPGSAERSKTLASLISKNLRSGQIRLQVETKQGVVYTIERKAGEPPEVFNERGEAVKLSPETGLPFGAQVYSQSEIAEIATRSADKLALIDRFAEDRLEELALEFRAVERKLRASAAELVGLAGEVAELGEDLDSKLLGVEEELRGLEAADGEADQTLQQALAHKSQRDSERRALDGLAEQLARGPERLAEEARGLMERLSAFAAEEQRGPNGALIQAAQDAARRLEEALGRAVTGLTEAARESQAEVARLRAQLVTAQREQEQEFEALLKAEADAQESAQRRIQAQRRQAELVARSREQESKRAAFEQKKEERRALTRRLSELRDQRAAVREQVVATLNRELEGSGIKIEFKRSVGDAEYTRLLGDAFRGSKRRGQTDIAKKIAQVTPREFVRLVSEKEVDGLAREAGLDKTDAAWVVAQLRDTGELYEIEAVERADEPRILFKDGEAWKDSADLSTGQQFTAVLPILLLHSDQPLICDEPESHLDQATLVEKVVTQIRNLEGRRQLIFATHNPNIVVLGDVGQSRVVVLESTGKLARVVGAGSVDERRRDVERLLEGGADAFQERARRYGFVGEPGQAHPGWSGA
ncbi:MAG: AAA family ATPase [Planctomycetota bacterium]